MNIQTKDTIIETIFHVIIIAAALGMVALGATFFIGCKAPKLEAGGVYAPTNTLGQVTVNELPLALVDASYKFAYETVLSPLRFEKEHRAEIYALSPTVGAAVKAKLDDIRAEVWKIDVRWALARKAYRSSPTPAGLTTLQTILAEVERLIPVAQSQLAPVYGELKPSTP